MNKSGLIPFEELNPHFSADFSLMDCPFTDMKMAPCAILNLQWSKSTVSTSRISGIRQMICIVNYQI